MKHQNTKDFIAVTLVLISHLTYQTAQAINFFIYSPLSHFQVWDFSICQILYLKYQQKK